MSARTTTILLFAILLAAPAVQAYGIKGDSEPSTSRDASDGYMWTTPSTTGNKVYFNGWGGQCIGYAPCISTSANPNFARLGSGHQVYPYQAFAMLGIWRDCNEDGFVGWGDNALLEYSTKLLSPAGLAICPVGEIPNPIPRNWLPIHNDGTLVREWLPVGWDTRSGTSACPKAQISTCSDINVFNVNDSESRVWADWDVPGAPPGTQCYVRPHQKGTWHSAGGIQTWADCFATNKISGAIGTAGLTGTWNTVKGNDCDNSYLVDYHVGCNPWGETKQSSYVDAFDCKSEGNPDDQVFQAPQDVLVGEQNVHLGPTLNVSRPRDAPTTTTRGSIAGTFNETQGEFDDCRENNWGDPAPSAAPYTLEGDLTNQNGRRFKHDQTMSYNEGVRPAAPVPINQAITGPSGPDDFGIGLRGLTSLGNTFEGYWVGNSITAASRNPYVDRDALQPMRVTYTTFYASVGPDATSRYGLVFPGTTGKYGSEACTTIAVGAPDANGWACDPDEWWPVDSAGKRTMPQRTISVGLVDIGVRVGKTYQLRDVDCWDESVTALRNEGVSYGLLTGSACA